MIFYTLLVLLLTFWLRYMWTKRHIYKLAWKLPGPFGWPLVGNALEFLCPEEDTFDVVVKLVNKYTSPLRLWIGPKCLFIFTDMNNVEKIMSSTKFADKDEIYEYLKSVDGEGLITASGLKWKKDRRVMGPMFLQKSINEYFPIMKDNSKILVEVLKKHINQGQFPAEKYLHRTVADIVNASIIGVKTDSHNGSRDDFLRGISRLYVIGHNRMVKVWLQPEFLFKRSYCYKEFETNKNNFHNFMRNAIDVASQRNRGKIYNTVVPLIDKMLAIREEHPWFATQEDLQHHLSTLYTAAEDTIMQISCFTLVLLGMHPLIQNKVSDELQQIIGKRDVELEDLDCLVYLDRCIKDVLRLFPIAPFIMRSPSENVTVGNTILPQGCSVMVSIQNIHRDPTLWEKPNEFYPDHFLPDAVKNRNFYAFLPFSAGPRGCIGKSYAYMTMKTILTTFLQHYIVETDKKFEDITLKTDISVRFKDDCYDIRIKKRI